MLDKIIGFRKSQELPKSEPLYCIMICSRTSSYNASFVLYISRRNAADSFLIFIRGILLAFHGYVEFKDLAEFGATPYSLQDFNLVPKFDILIMQLSHQLHRNEGKTNL